MNSADTAFFSCFYTIFCFLLFFPVVVRSRVQLYLTPSSSSYSLTPRRAHTSTQKRQRSRTATKSHTQTHAHI